MKKKMLISYLILQIITLVFMSTIGLFYFVFTLFWNRPDPNSVLSFTNNEYKHFIITYLISYILIFSVNITAISTTVKLLKEKTISLINKVCLNLFPLIIIYIAIHIRNIFN